MTVWMQVAEGGVVHAFKVPERDVDKSPCGKQAPRQLELPNMPEPAQAARCTLCKWALERIKKPKKKGKKEPSA